MRSKGYPLKGDKDEQKTRLLGSKPISHDKFFFGADKDIEQPRPKGRRFQLQGLRSYLEQTFGIRNRTSDVFDVLELESRASRIESFLDPDSRLVNCLVHTDFRINKVICNFCYNREKCNDQESRKFNQKIEYEILSQLEPKNKDDFKRIKSWLQEYNNPYNPANPLHQENMIFSDRLSPFRPGFSIQRGSKCFITRLDEVKSPNKLTGYNWNHLFYSEILGRTLTIFEAIYLNSVIQDNRYVDGIKSFPSIRDTKEFFRKNQFMNKRVTKSVINSNLDYFLSSRNSNLKIENPFLYGAISKTEQLFQSGLYNEKLEIFFEYDGKKDFRGHLICLWQEVISAIYSENLIELESNLFDPRIQGQIFYPKEEGKQIISLVLPLHVQILRLIPIEGLSESWLISNSQIPVTQYINNQNGKLFPFDLSQSNFKVSRRIEQLLLDSSRKYKARIWPRVYNEDFGESKYTRLNIFLSRDIYSAMSMNALFRKYVNSSGDSKQKRKQYQFQTILRDVFFFLIEKNSRNILDSIDRANLITLREEIMHPKYQRFKPLDILLKISEMKFNDSSGEKLSNPFIQYQQTTRDLKKTENFVLRSPKYIEDGTSGETIQSLEWVFVKESEIDAHGRIVSRGNKWKLLKDKGRKIRLHVNRVDNFCELLNWIPFKEKTEILQTSEAQSMYLSEGMEKLLQQGNQNAIMIWSKIIDILNQDGVYGCTFFITPTEFTEINQLIGEMRFNELHIDDLNLKILYGNPTEAITNLSPNFLHVGVLTD